MHYTDDVEKEAKDLGSCFKNYEYLILPIDTHKENDDKQHRSIFGNKSKEMMLKVQ